MCVTAVIAGASLLASAVGTASSISSANAQKSYATYEQQLRRKQIKERANLDRLAALEKENERSVALERGRSAAFAAIGAANIGDDISFFQGIDPDQKTAFGRDIRAVRLNLETSRASARDEIQVADYKARVSRFNADMSKVSAFAEFAKSAMNAANFYSAYSTPAAGGVGAARVNTRGLGGMGGSRLPERITPFYD